MAPQGTHYGALAMDEPARKSGRSATLKFLVGLALVAVCVTAAVFAFTSPKATVVDDAVDIATQLTRKGADCECKTECVLATGVKSGMGTCEVVNKECYGYDNEKAALVGGKNVAKCMTFSGRFQCWRYPCKNEGVCVEGVDGYTCKCHYGFEGKNCGTPINYCPQNVCAANAKCTPKLKRKVGSPAYLCACASGFHGDGYVKDQTKVAGGSILSSGLLKGSARHKGWLVRDASSSPECTDVDDCQEQLSSGGKISKQNPCKNGGKCTDSYKAKGMVNHFTCDCSVTLPGKRWMGRICEKDVNECKAGLDTCVDGKRGSCSNTPGSFTCSCKDGWVGDGQNKKGATGCTDENDCEIKAADGSTSSPCLNGGTCENGTPGSGEYVCDCKTGWKGKRCGKNVNECTEKGFMKEAWCQSLDVHGKCQDTLGSFRCICTEGYTGFPSKGKTCVDEDDCAAKPCGKNGTCEDRFKGYQCTCAAGYRGKECDKDWDECALGIHTCHKHARCINTMGSFKCACLPGYSGNGNRNGKCEKVNSCHVFDGDYVRLDKDKKEVEKCGTYDITRRVYNRRGQCTQEEHGYTCKCLEGWTDHNCNRNVDECATGTHTCARNAHCIDNFGPTEVQVDSQTKVKLGYRCKCNLGHTGDPYSAHCPDIDDCAYIHATCKKGGQMCENDGGCDTGDTCVKSNEARCVNGSCKDLGIHSWSCSCLEGWADADCGRDVDECVDHERFSCGKQAHCVNTKGSYSCKCNTGFLGDGHTCTEINDCASSPCANGVCQDHGAEGFGCVCKKGWTDTKCDFDVNECISGTAKCHKLGVCVNSPGSYYCRCKSGMAGDGYVCTDLDDCDPNPCCAANTQHGKATNEFGVTKKHTGCFDQGANKYMCACMPGYDGPNCCNDIDECKTGAHDCDANAYCINRAAKDQKTGRPQQGWTCKCKPGFYGTDGKKCTACTVCRNKAPKNGWKNKGNCEFTDFTCVDVNECALGKNVHKCDDHARCLNLSPFRKGKRVIPWVEKGLTHTCECKRNYFSVNPNPLKGGRYCKKVTKCPRGTYMAKQYGKWRDRVCRRVIQDGLYAIENSADSIAQCLTMWSEQGKVFPERYNWGGHYIANGKSSKDYAKNADACKDPVCGVCDYNRRNSRKNLELGNIAAWHFARIEKDDYLILSNADGKDYRCLGFDQTNAADGEPVMTYPQLMSWRGTTDIALTGVCAKDDKATAANTKCTTNAQCTGAGEICKKAVTYDGSWTTDDKGSKSLYKCDIALGGAKKNCKLSYFCGFSSLERLKADGKSATIWNVHQLGCKGDPGNSGEAKEWFCGKSKYDRKFLLRSYADQSRLANKDKTHYSFKTQCLYFPAPAEGGMGTSPRRVPSHVSDLTPGRWRGNTFVGDKTEDSECGFKPYPGLTQEESLIKNKRAVFHLIPLTKQNPRA